MVGSDPKSILRGFEDLWRERLRSASLIAELELSEQDLNLALRCLGIVWRQQPNSVRAWSAIRSSYKAGFVVALAGSASMNLKARRTWDPIMQAAGLPADPDGNTTNEWGKLFLACLTDLGLPTFPELDEERALRYVSRMLLHGGIPLDHLDEWFEVVSQAVRRFPDAPAADLQAWMAGRAAEKRLYGSTSSIDRFLRFGQQYAADFLDRSLELLDLVAAGADAGDIDVGLPKRYVTRAIELRELEKLPTRERRDRLRGTGRDIRPQLRFDPYGLGVHLRLPPVPTDDDRAAHWRLSLGGRTEELRLLSTKPGLPSPPADVPVPVGLVDLSVQLDEDAPRLVQVVDPRAPVLFFDETGLALPTATSLPRAPVWIVRPKDHELGDAVPVREQHSTVARWLGWAAELVDLDQAEVVQIGAGRPRHVQVDRAARLIDLAEVEHVTADGGAIVLSGWPTVSLPPSSSSTGWRVQVQAADTGETAERRFEVGPEGLDVALSEVGQGFAGRAVQILARGPLGRSLRRSVLVLPGLSVSVTPALRTPGPDGLAPTKVTFLGLDHEGEVLPPDVTTLRVDLPAGDTLLVQPPTVSIEHVLDGQSTTARHRPVALTREQPDDELGSLLVRLPGASSVDLIVHAADGHILQRLPTTRPVRSDGAALFELRRCLDTIRDQAAIVFAVASDVWDGRVATLRPSRLIDEAISDETRRVVQFVGVAGSGVVAAWYSHLVPALPPFVESLPTGDPARPVPDGLLGLGPLRVALRIDDPWVPPVWPSFPSGGDRNVYDVEMPADAGVLEAVSTVAPYLAGLAPFRPADARLDEALAVLEHLHELRVRVPADVLRRQLGRVLLAHPAAALEALACSDLDAAGIAGLSCETALVGRDLGTELGLEAIDLLWTRWEGLAGLATAALLDNPSLETAARRSLVSRCGPAADELLDGAEVDVLAIPRLDHPQMLEWSAAMLRQFRGTVGLVPRTLLDADSRAAAGFSLAEQLQEDRWRDELTHISYTAEGSLSFLLRQLDAEPGCRVLTSAIRRRIQGEGWQLVPALSLAYCSMARVVARYPSANGFGRRTREELGTLARAFPDLIGADLIMAELAIRGASA
jgi:hypothetical protein